MSDTRRPVPTTTATATATAAATATVLVAHPGAELYGSDRMVAESVLGLLEAGWSVLVALPGPGPLADQLSRAGARVVHCPSPVLRKSALRPAGAARLLVTTARAWTAGLRLVRQVDAVYVSTLTVPLWLALARRAGVPVLCHVHEAEGSAPLVLRAGLAAPLLLADRLLVNSEFSRQVLAASLPGLRARLGRARVVPNGVQGPPPPPRDQAVPATRPRRPDPVRLLYVGRLSPRKGVDVAVRALAELTDSGTPAVLTVAGSVYPGYEWYEAELRQLAEQLGVGDRLTLLGWQDDVWSLHAAADVVLVPSLVDEPFGNTAVEAVLAGRPVVVSDTSGLREAAHGYGCARLVPPGDPIAMAGAVSELLAHWSQVRRQADRDAGAAAVRHAPQAYRATVAEQVAALLPPLRRPTRPAPRPARTPATPKVVLAVATYRRPQVLAGLLRELPEQLRGLPARVLVVDNDPQASASAVAREAAGLDLEYVVEARPGISAARNRALAEAGDADLLVFIDDDERPGPRWLACLLETHASTGASAVVGPVHSRFETPLDPWITAGRFFDRRRLPTGTEVEVAATNNLLLDLAAVRAAGLSFDERFGLSGGSDTLFTRALHRAGGRLVWCAHAPVTDLVPTDRLTRSWVLRRQLRSGNSWARSSLALAGTRRERARERVGLSISGTARLAGGAIRAGFGTATGRPGLQARGARTLARGAGMLSGAWGLVYREYARPAPR